MTPVLFLDFDGPLFPDRLINMSLGTPYPGNVPLHPFVSYWEMDITSVRMLNFLYSVYQFDTVVSSSWIMLHGREQIEELFRVNGLNLVLHSDWQTNPDQNRSTTRVMEIYSWLERNRNEDTWHDHIILDDPASGSSLDMYERYQANLGLRNIKLINPDVGIDSVTYREMLTLVTNWRDDENTRTYQRKLNYV